MTIGKLIATILLLVLNVSAIICLCNHWNSSDWNTSNTVGTSAVFLGIESLVFFVLLCEYISRYWNTPINFNKFFNKFK